LLAHAHVFIFVGVAGWGDIFGLFVILSVLLIPASQTASETTTERKAEIVNKLHETLRKLPTALLRWIIFPTAFFFRSLEGSTCNEFVSLFDTRYEVSVRSVAER
jgi:hypothetical protein